MFFTSSSLHLQLHRHRVHVSNSPRYRRSQALHHARHPQHTRFQRRVQDGPNRSKITTPRATSDRILLRPEAAPLESGGPRAAGKHPGSPGHRARICHGNLSTQRRFCRQCGRQDLHHRHPVRVLRRHLHFRKKPFLIPIFFFVYLKLYLIKIKQTISYSILATFFYCSLILIVHLL